MTSSNECTLHPKVLMERHGQPLMESIRFKVTLEVNVLRVKNGLESEVRGSGLWDRCCGCEVMRRGVAW
jgi:hypothetical protein